MSDWIDRPRIEANLLNPALVALILSRSAHSYESEAGRPMPWPMAYIVVPLVLHRPTRRAFPRDTRTHFSVWVSRNPLLRSGFPRRAYALRMFVSEGLRLGLRTGALTMEGASLSGTLSKARPPTGELPELLKTAALLGRWLAHNHQSSSVFVLLGVSP